MTEQKSSGLQSIVGVVIVVGVAWFFFGGGLEKQAAKDMNNIYNQVANDAVKQYEMAQRSGTPIDICVQAGLVSASYLQAKDESNYQRWKRTEGADCARAGVPK